MAIFELSQRLPALATAKHVGVTHVRAVLGLPHAVQESLLLAAEHDRWTAGDLEARAMAHRSQQNHDRARPKRASPPALLATLWEIERRVSDDLGPAETASVTFLDSAEATRALDAVERLRRWCDALESRLRRPSDPAE